MHASLRGLACVVAVLALPALTRAQTAPSALFPDRTASVEAALVNSWTTHGTEVAKRRQIGDRYFLPALSGLVGAAGVGFSLSSEFPSPSRYAMASTAAVGLVGLAAGLLDPPRARYWAGPAVSLGIAGLGLSQVLDADHFQHTRDDVVAQRYIGAGFITAGLALLPALLVDPGPSADDYRAAALLPAEQRATRVLRLLLRADRAERCARGLVLGGELAATSVLFAGAASVADHEARKELMLMSLVFVIPAVMIALPQMLRKNRSELFLGGQLAPTGVFHW